MLLSFPFLSCICTHFHFFFISCWSANAGKEKRILLCLVWQFTRNSGNGELPNYPKVFAFLDWSSSAVQRIQEPLVQSREGKEREEQFCCCDVVVSFFFPESCVLRNRL